MLKDILISLTMLSGLVLFSILSIAGSLKRKPKDEDKE